MASMIEEIQKECNKLRDEYIPAYRSIGPAGNFAIAMMQSTITTAEQAIANGDCVQMIRSLQDLREFEL